MRPIPGRMFFLYMFSKGARKYQNNKNPQPSNE